MFKIVCKNHFCFSSPSYFFYLETEKKCSLWVAVQSELDPSGHVRKDIILTFLAKMSDKAFSLAP